MSASVSYRLLLAGLYDHVLTGNGIQTPGYKLPAIAPDASYAYIKIKEATDD
jgi:hypothetical protein